MSGDEQARKSLSDAALVAKQMRQRGRSNVAVVVALGAAMFIVTLVSGIAIEPPYQAMGFLFALAPLGALVIYGASRRVVPRHHRLLYSILGPLGALFYAVTVTVGQVWFPDTVWWWLIGSAMCFVPFGVIAALEIVAGRTDVSGNEPSA